ncbi:ABC transporter substrate-binding protein [Chromohalobacter japonicus]|uniref:ABC transporter substrate-binding protein n=2 Tax=Chromohalobacter japonicus TaxID=223900 RepID=A0A1Q8TGD9_9GAMM|nr:ABC transporter substrate-binding protein [Chromohalobacter japonicus]
MKRPLAGIALCVVTSFASIGQVVAAEHLKWAHIYETDTPMHKWAVWAADEFKKRTDGRYEIDVFPASSLGTQSQIDEGLTFGTVDIVYTGTQFAGRQYGPIGIAGAPYIFRDHDHWKAYRDSDLFAELRDGYQDKTGNIPVAMTYYGMRHVTANKPIHSPSDMRDLKIRTPNAPLYMMFPRAVGANVTPIAFSELYLALQQGVVDAQENPLHIIRSKRIYEVQDYINLTGHITDSLLTIVSGSIWNDMDEADQNILKDVLLQAAEQASRDVLKAEEELIAWFRGQGVKVIEVDRTPFREAVLPSLKAENDWSEETFQRLNSL